MERTIQPKKKSLRRELEGHVIGSNTVLRESVKTMDNVILLRNAHPFFRPALATEMLENGMISKWQASEFAPESKMTARFKQYR